jgi:hypothetical protein
MVVGTERRRVAGRGDGREVQTTIARCISGWSDHLGAQSRLSSKLVKSETTCSQDTPGGANSNVMDAARSDIFLARSRAPLTFETTYDFHGNTSSLQHAGVRVCQFVYPVD